MIRSQKSQILLQRVESVNEYMLFEVFQQALRSFYQVDRIIFVLLLALNIDLQSSKITEQEFTTFIHCTLPRSHFV